MKLLYPEDSEILKGIMSREKKELTRKIKVKKKLESLISEIDDIDIDSLRKSAKERNKILRESYLEDLKEVKAELKELLDVDDI